MTDLLIRKEATRVSKRFAYRINYILNEKQVNGWMLQ